MVAWRTGLLESGKDTGHVLLLAETPVADELGNFTARVYDSSNKAHFNDTRGDGAEFPDGVGSGFIPLKRTRMERRRFLFSPDATRFDELRIAIARSEPLR